MTYDKYTCEVSNPELRREFIGSSDASAIMGVSPWDTPLSLWETKLGLRPAKDLSHAMARGIALEPEARDKMKELTGIEYFPARVFSDEYPWIMANLDGLSTCGKYSVEIKCPGAADHEIAIAGLIPDKYFPQLQHQMIVSKHKWMYYLSYTKDNPILVKVEMNEDYQKKLIHKEKEFHSNLLSFTEPEKTDRDHVKRHDPAWRSAAHKHLALLNMISQLNDQLKESREDLLFLAQDKSCVGCGIKVIKSSRKGSIQYSKISEIQQVDLESYRSAPSEIWTVSAYGDEGG